MCTYRRILVLSDIRGVFLDTRGALLNTVGLRTLEVPANAQSTASGLVLLPEERHAGPVLSLAQVAARVALLTVMKTQTKPLVFRIVTIETFPVIGAFQLAIVEISSVQGRVWTNYIRIAGYRPFPRTIESHWRKETARILVTELRRGVHRCMSRGYSTRERGKGLFNKVRW